MATTIDYTQNIIDACAILKAQKLVVVYDATPAFDILANALRLLEQELQRSLTGKQTASSHRHSCLCGDYRTCTKSNCSLLDWVCPECHREQIFADICGLDERLSRIEQQEAPVPRIGDEGFIRNSDEGIRTVTAICDGWVVMAGGISCKANDFIVTKRS